jgi:hypothetical protein
VVRQRLTPIGITGFDDRCAVVCCCVLYCAVLCCAVGCVNVCVRTFYVMQWTQSLQALALLPLLLVVASHLTALLRTLPPEPALVLQGAPSSRSVPYPFSPSSCTMKRVATSLSRPWLFPTPGPSVSRNSQQYSCA